MQTIKTVYDKRGILNEEYPNYIGQIEIKYFSRSGDFEKGVLIGLTYFSYSDCLFRKLKDLFDSEDWLGDFSIDNNVNKRFVVFLDIWEKSTYILVDDIEEFICGIASCPQFINGINRENVDWRRIKYLDMNNKNEEEYASDLNIVPSPIIINLK